MGVKKVTFNLPDDEYEALTEMAERSSLSLTETIRRALARTRFLEDAQRDGGTILVEGPGETVTRQVVFR